MIKSRTLLNSGTPEKISGVFIIITFLREFSYLLLNIIYYLCKALNTVRRDKKRLMMSR